MFQKFHYSVAGFLPQRLSPQVRELYWSSLLQNLALAMLLLFEPIYLWQQGLGARGIILFFLGVYSLYLVVVPLGANFATHFGFKHSMALSTIWQVAYYGCLYLVVTSWWWLVPAVIFYVLQKTFYWPAYHADFAKYSVGNEEAREISGLSVATLFVFILGPLLAGLILQVSSWLVLFSVGSALIFLSNWPLLSTKEEFSPRQFPYADTFRRLFSKSNRQSFLSYLGFGEELIALTLWPVFMAIVVVSYVEVGAVVASATLLTALATLYIGKLSDRYNKHHILQGATLFYMASWLVRIVVTSSTQIFLVDGWSRLAKNVVAIPLTAITYERAQKGPIMDTVVFFEMSLVVGKILAALILLLVFIFTSSWSAVWLVAGTMTLLYLKL